MSTLRTLLAPRVIGAHLLMVLVVAATIALGVWQYGASQEKKQAQIAELVHAAPQPLDRIFGANASFPAGDLGRPVIIKGSWAAHGTVLISGREHAGEKGYWVASPVEVNGTGSDMYVVRGWTPSPTRVPAPPHGTTTVVGWLQPPQENEVTDQDPKDDVLPQLDITTLINRVDRDLYGGYVMAAGREHWSTTPVNDGSRGLTEVAAPAPPKADSSTGLRNFLYALEWWAFSLFAIYVWWRYVRDVTSPPAEEEPETEPQEDAVPSGS